MSISTTHFQCYNEYGDIIKATMGKAREINKINCALTMCLSLISTYKEIQKTNDSIYVSKSSQAFTDLKVRLSNYFSILGEKIVRRTVLDYNFWTIFHIFVFRNWPNDLHSHLVWMQWKTVKRSFHCIELEFCLPSKIIAKQLMIHQLRRHACYSWKFWTNSPTNCWNRTKKLCKCILCSHIRPSKV